LSLKRAKKDPWENADKHIPGAFVRGTVTRFSSNEVFVQLDDGIDGVMSEKEIVPWDIDKPSNILEIGDRIEAEVLRRDEEKKQIVLSMKSRLLKLEEQFGKAISSKQISEESQQGIPPLGGEFLKEEDERFEDETLEAEFIEDEEETEGELIDEQKEKVEVETSKVERRKPIRTILVADDLNDVCQAIQMMLEEMGYEVDTVQEPQQCVTMALEHKYDLILIDAHMPKNKEGLDAAKKILEQWQSACVVIITGQDIVGIIEYISNYELNVAGILVKPISKVSLKSTIEQIEATGHGPWPNISDEKTTQESRFIQQIRQIRREQRPLKVLLTDLLKEITTKRDASRRGVIISHHAITNETRLVASVKISERALKRADGRLGGRLRYSPVTDVIYRREHIIEYDVRKYASGRFRYFFPIYPNLRSCIAVPIEAAGDIGYGLFLFHLEPGHYRPDDLPRAEAVAAQAGTIISERRLIKEIAREQRFTLLGQVSSGLGHELRNRLQPIESVDTLNSCLENLRKRLKDGSVVLSERELNELTEPVNLLAESKKKMTDLVEALLELTGEKQYSAVDVNTCVERACMAANHDANKHHVKLVRELDTTLPQIQGSAVELEQVFLNIILNGIQNMENAPRKLGEVRIETKHEPKDNEYPVKIRIIDTGPGIRAKYKDRIFDAMFSTKEKGTGMELFMSRVLITAMGGKLELEDTAIHVGSSFKIELPIATVKEGN
jgi:signal transduction histidine kinase/CheY-like chemotaxis protein/predicted RNA-binding protein with RPS1 domain